MERGKIGFVVGLRAEAALLKGRGFAIGVGGGTPAGAAAAARSLAAAGATALVSFGLAGGLDPRLCPGALVVPGEVLGEGAVHACDPGLLAFLGGATAARVYAGAEIAATAAEKSALFAQTGAAAVDLESGAVAGVAAALGLPFAVLRAVVDAAACSLPPAALRALEPSGRVGLARVLASVLRQPGQIPDLLRLARDAGQGRQALVRALATLH